MEKDRLKPLNERQRATFTSFKSKIRADIPKSEAKALAIVDDSKNDHPVKLVTGFIKEFGFDKAQYPGWLKKIEADFGKEVLEKLQLDD